MKKRVLLISVLAAVTMLLASQAAFAADSPLVAAQTQGKATASERIPDYYDVTSPQNILLADVIEDINRNSETTRAAGELLGALPKYDAQAVTTDANGLAGTAADATGLAGTTTAPSEPADASADSTPGALEAQDLSAQGTASYKNYTYKITPLLAPFNQYFFVETDNPNPRSFRFADKSSAYADDSTISLSWDGWDDVIELYADVKYAKSATGRVKNGGYIFYSGDTDGGKLVLQVSEDADAWNATWEDTKITASLPALVDNTDYLINTYADKSKGFFDNMDAVQAGFSSICLYSGSFIRGKIVKTSEYWSAAVAGHIDQSFYIYSPYEREGSKTLFASAIYPFRYDSLGFPGMMASVAKRLDSGASYQWNSSDHSLVDVTFQGETRSYGGQGNGEGQGISEDKISQWFTFGTGGTKITLTKMRSLLDDYAAVKMDDDIPRDDALTWKQIYDTVGNGSWTRLLNNRFAFFYQNGDGTDCSGDEWGVGYSSWWGGDLGYARDAWVDGRYVGEWRHYVPGATFAEHPTSSIILTGVAIPQITYETTYNYNESTDQYDSTHQITGISEEEKTVLFRYSDGKWTATYSAFNGGCASADTIAELVEEGVLDTAYLDMVTITQDEIAGLGIDANTNIDPDKGFIFDGTVQPGKAFDHLGKGHSWDKGKRTWEPTCSSLGELLFTCPVCGITRTESLPMLSHSWGKWRTIREATAARKGVKEHTCEVCSKSERATIPVKSKGSISAKVVKKSQAAKTSKTTKIKAAKAFKVTRNASKGKVTYALVKVPKAAKKYIKVAKNGTITVKKGLKKGSYKITVKLTSAKTAKYAAASTKVSLKIVVKAR